MITTKELVKSIATKKTETEGRKVTQIEAKEELESLNALLMQLHLEKVFV